MSKQTYDDPRQILEILNSVGIVGITAKELKEFMKELKLYKKVRDKECQLWKDEMKAKIMREQNHIQNKCINVPRSNSVQNKINLIKREAKQDKNKRTHQCDSKVNVDNSLNANYNKKKCKENKPPSIAVTLKFSNTPDKIIKKLENEESKKCNEGTKNENDVDKTVVRPSRKRTKSTNSSDSRSRSIESRSRSKSRSKSFIRSRNPSETRSTLSKTMASDPVALYNKYKSFWDKISFPGEESHAQLRWDVREKMLGSNPAKPTVKTKKQSKTRMHAVYDIKRK